MKIELIDYAIWKFPKKSLKNLCWIWLSKEHSSIFISLEGNILIYNELEKKWKKLSLKKYNFDTECAEALTTTDKYLVFAGMGGNFVIYQLPQLKHIKTIEIENSGFGAASFKNYIFINELDPFGIQMLELPSGRKIKNFPVKEILGSGDCLLNCIGCNETYITGFFSLMEQEKQEFYYITWNFHDSIFISKIPFEREGYEAPMIIEDNLIIVDNKIYNLITSEILLELDLLENELIMTAIENSLVTFFDEGEETNRIRIYNRQQKSLVQDLEFHVDDFHTFKNRGDYFLIQADNHFYLIPVKKLVNLLKDT